MPARLLIRAFVSKIIWGMSVEFATGRLQFKLQEFNFAACQSLAVR